MTSGASAPYNWSMRRALAVATLLVAASLGAAYAAGAFGGSTLPSFAPAPARPLSVRGDLRLAEHVRCRGNHPHLVGRDVFGRFHPVTAVLCTEGFRTYPGQGQWEVLTRKVAVGGIPAYQRYFEQPDGPALPKSTICSGVLVGFAVPVFIDDEGRTLVPRTPVDACGAPLDLRREGALAAGVRWRVVGTRRIRQTISAPALAAHCPMRWGNTVAWAGPPRDSDGGALFPVAPRTVRICVFRAPADHFAVGRFVRGFRLGASQTRRLLGALTGPGPKVGCPKQRTFAVVIRSPGSVASVELGGCWRVERADRLAGTAKPAMVTAILERR